MHFYWCQEDQLVRHIVEERYQLEPLILKKVYNLRHLYSTQIYHLFEMLSMLIKLLNLLMSLDRFPLIAKLDIVDLQFLAFRKHFNIKR